jgi:hypothetical protein
MIAATAMSLIFVPGFFVLVSLGRRRAADSSAHVG